MYNHTEEPEDEYNNFDAKKYIENVLNISL